jgi:hypothetical protein
VPRSGTYRAAGCCYFYEQAKAEKGEDATARHGAEGCKQAKAEKGEDATARNGAEGHKQAKAVSRSQAA